MALRQNASVASDHGSIEGEALLGDAFIDQRLSFLTESMAARIKTSWSRDKPITEIPGDSRSLALESLRDSHDLDNANLRAQGHEAALQRSFSASAAVGLGFGNIKLLTGASAAPLYIYPKSVPRFVQATLYISVSGFIVIFCMLLGLKKHTQPGSFVTHPGPGTSGWNPGAAWVLGVGNML
ncbi:MAG: hypothetical protein Q9194_003220 [Teloschistes cf. exilis]